LLRVITLLVIVVSLAGCPSGSGEGLDENGRPLGESNGVNGNLEPALASIQANIFTPGCALSGCHSGGSAPLGLRLDEGNSFASLVNTASQEVAGLFRVQPFDPDSSYLIQKLEGTAAVGARMPLNGIPLEPSEIAVIREWIANGALDDTPAVPAGVVTVTPSNGDTLDALPNEITVIFNQDMDAASLTPDTFILERSGGDGGFDDGNEVAVIATAIDLSTNLRQAIMDLSGSLDIDDSYRVTLVGTGAPTVTDSLGNALDGDADGLPGGNFSAVFTVVPLLPTLTSIQNTIFTPVCSVCHVDGGVAGFTGLWLDEASTVATLIDIASFEVPALLRVRPGDPDDSYLIQKLEGTAAVGEQMPQGGPFLSQQTIDTIRQWIGDGAQP
jgi:hypothetical protein